MFPASDVRRRRRGTRRAAAASGATQAFLASKALIAALRDERLGLWESIDAENRAQAALCDTDDYREGFAAFQQKREPTFTAADRGLIQSSRYILIGCSIASTTSRRNPVA